MDSHDQVIGIAIVALAATACGILMARLRQPAIVGYILAGVLLGPSGFALVNDRGVVSLLAELGVIMLLFIIGMELPVRRFAEVWKIAVATTLLQVAGSVGVMLGLRYLLHWPLGTAVLLGYAAALSSTAVVFKMLDQLGERHGPAGRLTVGILIAQDMAVVPMMLSLGAFTKAGFTPMEMGKVGLSVAVLAGLVLLLRKREIRLPFSSTVARDSDLAPLGTFAFCFGAATLAGSAGLSAGYGAFLAGLILGNSEQGHKLMPHALPIQTLLLVVFFLSVGLLVDLGFLWANLGTVLLLLLAVLVIKTMLNITALRLQRVSWADATLAGLAMAQIGEFSFLLAGMGQSRGLLDSRSGQLVVAVTVLSLAVSPLWLFSARRLGAAGGRTFASLGDVLSQVYGREASWVRRAAGAVWLLARHGNRKTLNRIKALPRPARGLPRLARPKRQDGEGQGRDPAPPPPAPPPADGGHA